MCKSSTHREGFGQQVFLLKKVQPESLRVQVYDRPHLWICSGYFPGTAAVIEGAQELSWRCFCTLRCRVFADVYSVAPGGTKIWRDQGLNDKELFLTVWGCRYRRRRGVLWHSPVSDVITTGEVEMLQSLEIRCSLCHSTVTDPRAVAEGQAGEAAAVPGYWCQAGVGDLRQHGEWQTVEVRVTHHLRKGETVPIPDFLKYSAFLLQTHTHIGLSSASHLCDAAVGEFVAGRQVQLLQPVEG